MKSTITRLPSCLTLAGIVGSESCTTKRPAPSGERLKSTPVMAREATLAWSLPAAGIEPIRVDAGLPLPGVVVAHDISLPQPGRWRLRLDLLIDDFTRLTYEGEIDVR